MFFVKEHFEWYTIILIQQFINDARLYNYCNKKLMPLWLCNKVWPSITLNKAILHEILDTSLNSFRFMLYIGVKEWICIHKNCCHDESNDLREDKLICLLTEMEFHTFQDHPVLNYHTWAMVMGPLHTQGLDFIGTLHLVNGRLLLFLC